MPRLGSEAAGDGGIELGDGFRGDRCCCCWEPGMSPEEERRKPSLAAMGASAGRARDCPSLPRLMDWWAALPREMQVMDSMSFWTGVNLPLHSAITSSMGGGGEGKPNSSQ